MKLIEVYNGILLREFSDKLKNQMIEKFRLETGYFPERISFIIDKFDHIKDRLPVEERDITKYSWDEINRIVYLIEKKRVKVGRFNPVDPGDKKLVYNENGLRIYEGDNERECIKYGHGYNFCISARSGDNMFSTYGYDEEGRIFFIFDDTKSFEKDVNGKFIDNDHLMVLIHYFIQGDPEYGELDVDKYTLTDANNDKTLDFENFAQIERKFPRLLGMRKVFDKDSYTDEDRKERKLYDTRIQTNIELMNLNMKYRDYGRAGIRVNGVDDFKYFNGIVGGRIKKFDVRFIERSKWGKGYYDHVNRRVDIFCYRTEGNECGEGQLVKYLLSVYPKLGAYIDKKRELNGDFDILDELQYEIVEWPMMPSEYYERLMDIIDRYIRGFTNDAYDSYYK